MLKRLLLFFSSSFWTSCHRTDTPFVFFLCQIAQKYDMQREEELRFWIEEVTGMPIGENFQQGLKDGVILCE